MRLLFFLWYLPVVLVTAIESWWVASGFVPRHLLKRIEVTVMVNLERKKKNEKLAI